MKLDTTRKTCSDEPFYYSPPCNLSDFICSGSDQDETPEKIEQKHYRYEIEARRYQDGKLPILQSTILKGPISDDWVNPWQQEKNRTEEDWWQPDSDRLYFTRKKLMKKAASYGLGYLTPGDALAWCKASAEDAIHVDTTHSDIPMTKVVNNCVKEHKLSENSSKKKTIPRKRKLEHSSELRCDTSSNADRHDYSPEDSRRALKRVRRSQRLEHQTQCTKLDGRIISSPSLTLHLNKKRRSKAIASSQKVDSFYFKSKPSSKSSQSLHSKKKQVLQEELDVSDVSQVVKPNITSINFKKRTKRKRNSSISIKKKKDGPDSDYPQEESCLLGLRSSAIANIDQKSKLQCEPETPAATIPLLKKPLLCDNFGKNENEACSRQDELPVSTSQIKKSILPFCLRQQNIVEQHSFVTDYAPSSRDLDKFMFKKKVRVKRKTIGGKRSLPSQYTPSSNKRETSQSRKRIKTFHISYDDSKASDQESKTDNPFLQKPPPNYGSTTASIDSSPEIDSTSRVQIYNRLKLNSTLCNDANRSTQETPKFSDIPLTCSTKMKPRKSNIMNSFPTNLSSQSIPRIQRRKKIKTGSFPNNSVLNPVSPPINLTQSWTSKEQVSKGPLKGLDLIRSCPTPNLVEIPVLTKDETALCTNIAPAGRSLISAQKQDFSPEYDCQHINSHLNIDSIKWPIDPNDRSNERSSSTKNNSLTTKKDSWSSLSIPEDILSLGSPHKRLSTIPLKDSENFDYREIDLKVTSWPEKSSIDDEGSKMSKIPCLDTTNQKPWTPMSPEVEKDTSTFSRRKKPRSQSQVEQNLLSASRLKKADLNILDRKILAQLENDIAKEPSLSKKSLLEIQPQSPWSTEVQPVILDVSETSTKLYPLDNDINKTNIISEISGNTQADENEIENEKTLIEQDCVQDEGNPTHMNTDKIGCSNHTRTLTPRSDFQVDVNKLYQSALKNPWKGIDKMPDSAKTHKRVSFGILDSTVKIKHPEQMIKLRRSSNNSTQSLLADQQEINHNMSIQIKSPENVAVPLLSAGPYPSYGRCSIDESPGVGAMAEAFLAAEGKIETEKSHPAQSKAPALPSLNRHKNDGLFPGRSDDNPIKPDEFGAVEDDLALDIGAIAEFDADAILGNLGDILEDWTVESELLNINKFAKFNQQSTEAWSKSFTSN